MGEPPQPPMTKSTPFPEASDLRIVTKDGLFNHSSHQEYQEIPRSVSPTTPDPFTPADSARDQQERLPSRTR